LKFRNQNKLFKAASFPPQAELFEPLNSLFWNRNFRKLNSYATNLQQLLTIISFLFNMAGQV